MPNKNDADKVVVLHTARATAWRDRDREQFIRLVRQQLGRARDDDEPPRAA